MNKLQIPPEKAVLSRGGCIMLSHVNAHTLMRCEHCAVAKLNQWSVFLITFQFWFYDFSHVEMTMCKSDQVNHFVQIAVLWPFGHGDRIGLLATFGNRMTLAGWDNKSPDARWVDEGERKKYRGLRPANWADCKRFLVGQIKWVYSQTMPN